MSKEDFVSFSQALKLKELGFDYAVREFFSDHGNQKEHRWLSVNRDGSCYHGSGYPFVKNDNDDNTMIARPTLDVSCKWLRSKDILIHPFLRSNTKYSVQVWKISSYDILETLRGEFDTYEQAQSAGIDVALVLLERERNLETV